MFGGYLNYAYDVSDEYPLRPVVTLNSYILIDEDELSRVHDSEGTAWQLK